MGATGSSEQTESTDGVGKNLIDHVPEDAYKERENVAGTDTDERAPEGLRGKLWRALLPHKGALRTKEMREACAFYDSVRKDARRIKPEVVIDACGGHGALGMLFVVHGVAKSACIIDQMKPNAHDVLLSAWRDFMPDDNCIIFDQRSIQQALPHRLEQYAASVGTKVLVVACHACQHLTRSIIDSCIHARVDFAVCPCCPKDPQGGIQAAASALGVDFGVAMTLAEMGRASDSCVVHLRTFDADVSPQNRIIIGSFEATKRGPRDTLEAADERLRRAYQRAHKNGIRSTTTAAECVQQAPAIIESVLKTGDDVSSKSGNCSQTTELDSASYEAELGRKAAWVTSLLCPLTLDGRLAKSLLEEPGMEFRRSPICNFRARTIVSIGEAETDSPEGLFRYVVDDANHFELKASIPVGTLIEIVAKALPLLAELLNENQACAVLKSGLRCVKFHGTLCGTPTQLLLCFIYGPGSDVASEKDLQVLRDEFSNSLVAAGMSAEVIVMAQARGMQRCVPTGHDFVDEALNLGDRVLRYRQPFGQFSNPNPHIAVATAAWLLDVIRTSVNCENDGAPCTDLLELYCGAGSHTVALAPLFRHVLAVEINRHLVKAANHNVEMNNLDNVTVVRAPSEEFCRRVLRRRTYELRHEDGSARLKLEFGCTVVDPPRAGLDDVTRQAVSGYGHVLYVSCNPEALRRDLDCLLNTHEVRRLVILDHFPCSAHVETAVYLRRRSCT